MHQIKWVPGCFSELMLIKCYCGDAEKVAASLGQTVLYCEYIPTHLLLVTFLMSYKIFLFSAVF
jgi:hypothetical protein